MNGFLRQSLALSRQAGAHPAFIIAVPLRACHSAFLPRSHGLSLYYRNHQQTVTLRRYRLHHKAYATIASVPQKPSDTLSTDPAAAATAVVAPAAMPGPTSATLIAHIKQKASQNGVRKIVAIIAEAEAGEGPWGAINVLPDATAYNTAIRAVMRLERPDLAGELYSCRMGARASRPESLRVDPHLAAAVIRSALKDARKRTVRADVADMVFDNLVEEAKARMSPSSSTMGAESATAVPEMAVESATAVPRMAAELPFGGDNVTSGDGGDGATRVLTDVERDVPRLSTAFASIGIASLGAVHTAVPLRPRDLKRAKTAVAHMQTLAVCHGALAAPSVEACNELIRAFGKARRLGSVFDVLDVMAATGVEKSCETFEFVANAAVRQVSFVTGAVSMNTLPEPLAVEVAFVGRSNVGKSSLVNMMCNRKALAYVSGRPGKTQQFNYFVVNERDAEQKFHIVDLPGVGYAKVPREVQDEWLRFMQHYLRQRMSLALVFHLIDGRHGALADDEELMQQMGKLRGAFKYVLVLTKMDKMYKQKAKQKVIESTRDMLRRSGCDEDVPIVATSANSKLGRAEMWRHMQEALRKLQPHKK